MSIAESTSQPSPVTTSKATAVLRDYAIVWITALLFAVLAITTPNFATGDNLRNVVDQQATLLIVASLATLTIIAGGFDISLGAIYIISPLVAFRVENATGSLTMAVAAGIITGLLAGGCNGLIVAVLKINSFIATLATSFMFAGLGYVISDRSLLRPDDFGFRDFAVTRFLGLTSATWMAIAVVVVSWVVLSRTRMGRYIFASGGNPAAARLAGVRVPRTLMATFVLSGMGAGFAGTIAAAQALSAQASDDFSLVFAAIAAVVVGGTSIAGGEGAVWKTVVGVFFIALLTNGFNLNGVDPVYQRIIQGAVILAAVGVDAATRARRT